MPPILDLQKIVIHFPWRPGAISGRIRDCLPVTVVRSDDDHRVMRGTASQGASTRIKNSMPAFVSFNQIFWILFLTLFVGVVANVEVQAHIRIFGGPTMKHRYLVIPVLLFLLCRFRNLCPIVPPTP